VTLKDKTDTSWPCMPSKYGSGGSAIGFLWVRLDRGKGLCYCVAMSQQRAKDRGVTLGQLPVGWKLGHIPVGWKLVQGKWVKTEQYRLVELAHTYRKQGWTLQRIADELMKQGELSSGLERQHASQVKRLVDSPLEAPNGLPG